MEKSRTSRTEVAGRVGVGVVSNGQYAEANISLGASVHAQVLKDGAV